MRTITTITDTRQAIQAARSAGNTIGLVPTMGALHEGHFSLIRRSVAECDFTAVSVFVNPTQFGPNEDLDAYPRTLEEDCRACRELGADLVFAPAPSEMYAQEQLAWIEVQRLDEHLCGASRPGHFRGVCTVVAKLFNILTPDRAYFGQKDIQQLAILQRMTADLNFPVEIVPCPTVREGDGLALSSRNAYLSPDERAQATCLYQALRAAQAAIDAGERSADTILQQITPIIQGGEIDYISILDKQLMQPIDTLAGQIVIALAVRFPSARLIDNIVVDLGPAAQ